MGRAMSKRAQETVWDRGEGWKTKRSRAWGRRLEGGWGTMPHPLTGITLQASGVPKAVKVSKPRAKKVPSSAWYLWYATGYLAQWPQLPSPGLRPQPWHCPNPGPCVQVTVTSWLRSRQGHWSKCVCPQFKTPGSPVGASLLCVYLEHWGLSSCLW